jgi:hypothetical protein
MSVVKEGKEELKELVSSYHPEDVFNTDETSFFYRRKPRGTLTTDKKEKGKKQSKVRVTVCVGTNADGSKKLPLRFVGKAKKPRPFKNHNVFEETGATYTNTPKAWMNTAKFCEWLTDLNESMRLHVLCLRMTKPACSFPTSDWKNYRPTRQPYCSPWTRASSRA